MRPGRRDLGRHPRGLPGVAPARAPHAAPARPAGCSDLRDRRALAARCATSGARYLRHPHLRTFLDRYATYTGSDPRRAPGRARHRAVRRADVRRLVRARRPAPARGRRAARGRWSAAPSCGPAPTVARVLLDAAGRRAAGVRLADGEHLPADVVVANADAAHVYARPAARAGRRPRPRGAAPGDAVAVRVRAAARAARAHPRPRAPHRAVPGRLRRRVRLRVRHRSAPAPVHARCRTRPSTSARPTTRRCARTPTRGVVRAGQRPAARPGGRRRLGRAGAAPRRTPTGSSTCSPRAGSTCATGCCWREVRTPGRPGAGDPQRRRLDLRHRSNGARAAFLRPANRSPVPGLFLVGGSAHPGGGLPLVGLSAAIVAGLVGPA